MSNNPTPNFYSRFFRYYSVLFLIFIAFILGFVLGRQNEPKNIDPNVSGKVYNKNIKPAYLSEDVNFNLFWEAWKKIEDNYLRRPISETELFYGAMAGSVAALGDPHSNFFDPETTKQFNDEMTGQFEGIGAEIAIKNEQLTIVAPLPESPAEKVGLRSGDWVTQIDGTETTGMSLEFAISKIRGPKATEVNLTIQRNGSETANEFKITRDTIKVQSVKLKMLDNKIAHIQLREFNQTTSADLNKIIVEIINQNPRGIVLDLRDDPGGYFDTAVEVASEWIEDGVVAYEKTGDGKLQPYEDSFGRPRLKDFPTVVLVNKGSASASEIVAGALQEHNIAKIVGEKTFGKGTVQRLFDLADGSSLKLTIAEWLTPNKNSIDKQGIEPDVKVELSKDDFNNDKDPQLDKAVEMLLQK